MPCGSEEKIINMILYFKNYGFQFVSQDRQNMAGIKLGCNGSDILWYSLYLDVWVMVSAQFQ